MNPYALKEGHPVTRHPQAPKTRLKGVLAVFMDEQYIYHEALFTSC